MEAFMAILAILMLYLIFIGMPIFTIKNLQKIYHKTGGKDLDKYNKDELNYRKKVKEYISKNIDALIWHHIYPKPVLEKKKIDFGSLPKDTFKIETGANDIEYQFIHFGLSNAIQFSILNQVIMVVLDNKTCFTTSDEYKVYDKNLSKTHGGVKNGPQNNPYLMLQHDIPTIALVYIEHYIRNCVEEREKYHQSYSKMKDNEKIKVEQDHDTFNDWEKVATNHFINKYKDEYGIESSLDDENVEDIYEYHEEENQVQNG